MQALSVSAQSTKTYLKLVNDIKHSPPLSSPLQLIYGNIVSVDIVSSTSSELEIEFTHLVPDVVQSIYTIVESEIALLQSYSHVMIEYIVSVD